MLATGDASPRSGPPRAWRRRFALSPLLTLACAFGCSSSGVVAPRVTVELRNAATDPRLYGSDGVITVLLEPSVLGERLLDPGTLAATLAPGRDAAFDTDLGNHVVALHDADEAGHTTLLSTLAFWVGSDGATIEVRVTPDGGLCLLGQVVDGVRCEDR